MSRFVIFAALDGDGPVKYLFNSAKKALAKVITFERNNKGFTIKDGETDTPMSIDDLRQRAALEP